MSDMAHQSCFITAITFIKFDSLAPEQRLAESGPDQTEAVLRAGDAAIPVSYTHLGAHCVCCWHCGELMPVATAPDDEMCIRDRGMAA